MEKNNGTQVAILMSTFNGEKYIAEQIESIQKQTYKNWKLFIRDDGSSDNTLTIINEYCSRDKRITILKSKKNVGIVGSFLALLKHAKSKFYMFCDQDDVWLHSKIQDSLEVMNSVKNQDIPVCIHTDFSLVNSKLDKINENKSRNIFSSFEKVLFCNCVVGCTIMINDALKKLIDFENFNYKQIYMHDWWFALIAAEFGQLKYLDKKTILYRQHLNNVVGNLNYNPLFRIFNNDYDKKEINKTINMASAFFKTYGERMSGRNLEYVANYGALLNNSDFLNNLKLILKLPPQRRMLIQRMYYSYLLLLFSNSFKQN